jgi:hypothetical protein
MPHIAESTWMLSRKKGLNMRSKLFCTVSVVSVCAGYAQSAYEPAPVTLEPSRGTVNNVAHIYYNVVSGERVVTVLGSGQTAPADTGTSEPVWATLVQNSCEAQGYTTEFYYGVDAPDGYILGQTGLTLLDYGDIETDTVVDCIQVNWVVNHPDTDLDSDGVGDGVEELAANWIIWDAHNGRPECMRVPMVDLLFFNLPGNTPDNVAADALTGYTMDIDLVAFGTATDLSFEIGNTDGDCQSAAFCVDDLDTDFDGIGDGADWDDVDLDFDGLPDSDLDGDGLFDWSWSVRFFQPGYGTDFDSDGDSGVRADVGMNTIGISFGFPEGSAIDNGDGTWTWDIDSNAQAAGTGQEDRFVLYDPPNSSGEILYNGGYWFGGFACTGGLIDTGGTGYTPPAMFQFQLYGPVVVDVCNPADLNLDGVLNFFDVSLFLLEWQGGGDYNGDGSTDFFDVSAFLVDFNAGCP